MPEMWDLCYLGKLDCVRTLHKPEQILNIEASSGTHSMFPSKKDKSDIDVNIDFRDSKKVSPKYTTYSRNQTHNSHWLI